MKKLFAIAAASAAVGMLAPAGAVNFKFKTQGGPVDMPTSNVVQTCGTVGVDLCTDVNADGFTYSKMGVEFTARAFEGVPVGGSSNTGGTATLLIQDLQPIDSGLAALSENDNLNDQTQFDTNESIEFTFAKKSLWRVSNIEFNAGNDRNCSAAAAEGPCGEFELFIDGVSRGIVEAIDVIANGFLVEQVFEFVPITEGAGFAVAQFDVKEVPIPGALPLLLSGIAGLGFAARRRKQA